MQTPEGGASWEVCTGSGWSAALVVRQALALPYSPWLPALDLTSVTNLRGAMTRPPAQAAWLTWIDAIAASPGRPTRPDDPVLAGALDAAEPYLSALDAVDEPVYRPMWSADLLARSRLSGRRYVVETVPVGMSWHHGLSPDHLLVSRALLADTARMDAVLRPRLRRALGLADEASPSV